MRRGILFSLAVVLLAGCAERPSPRITFVYAGGKTPIRLVAQVQPDGTFSNDVRRGDRMDIFSGTVTPELTGDYRVLFRHEGRRYVIPDGGFEYNAYTNGQALIPNQEKVLWRDDDSDRKTYLKLDIQEASNKTPGHVR